LNDADHTSAFMGLAWDRPNSESADNRLGQQKDFMIVLGRRGTTFLLLRFLPSRQQKGVQMRTAYALILAAALAGSAALSTSVGAVEVCDKTCVGPACAKDCVREPDATVGRDRRDRNEVIIEERDRRREPGVELRERERDRRPGVDIEIGR
jgi:hypothetical protein